jgi:hypothetical protein
MGDRAEEGQLAGFARGRHAAYLQAMALELPRDYANQEVMHLTLAYFADGKVRELAKRRIQLGANQRAVVHYGSIQPGQKTIPITIS